ncbi:Ribosomal RNA-processing protein 7, C-terminal domain [Dillenia turbinata]|uniref:Ribosomal RNA-processing protein 7, C-terminal domain n=1 Tax=Dillenia turbinata TaxID=194707 RepID=A0AAN8ZH54_9MAGN
MNNSSGKARRKRVKQRRDDIAHHQVNDKENLSIEAEKEKKTRKLLRKKNRKAEKKAKAELGAVDEVSLTVADDHDGKIEETVETIQNKETKMNKSFKKKRRKGEKNDKVDMANVNEIDVENEKANMSVEAEAEKQNENLLQKKKRKFEKKQKAISKKNDEVEDRCDLQTEETMETIQNEIMKMNKPLKKKRRKGEKSKGVDAANLDEVGVENEKASVSVEAEAEKQNEKLVWKKKRKLEKKLKAMPRKNDVEDVSEEQSVKMQKAQEKKDKQSATKDEKLQENGGAPEPDEVFEISSGDEDSSKGMKKWITEYHESRPGLKALQQQIDEFITSYEAQEEQARNEKEARIAEGGWTVVVHHKGRKKTTESESGVAVGSVAEAAVLDKMAKKKSKEVGLDFYRFHKKEAQRNGMFMLSRLSLSAYVLLSFESLGWRGNLVNKLDFHVSEGMLYGFSRNLCDKGHDQEPRHIVVC